jgi:hypothetical protein
MGERRRITVKFNLVWGPLPEETEEIHEKCQDSLLRAKICARNLLKQEWKLRNARKILIRDRLGLLPGRWFKDNTKTENNLSGSG